MTVRQLFDIAGIGDTVTLSDGCGFVTSGVFMGVRTTANRRRWALVDDEVEGTIASVEVRQIRTFERFQKPEGVV